MKKLTSLLLVLLLALGACAISEGAPKVITVASWLESGGVETGLIAVQVMEIINPVLAVVADETGSVNLFGVTIDGRFTDFYSAEINAGDFLLLWNPVYNEYEGTVEMADSELLRHIVFNSQGSGRVEATQYEFTASADEEQHIYDTAFYGEVAVCGEGQSVYFHNCEFHGNVVSYAPSATMVWIMDDCEFFDGAHCVLKSGVREANIDYSIPKFALLIPVDVECEDLGGVLVAGSFDVVINGTTFTDKDIMYYQNADGSIVPYEEGMPVSGRVAMHWWENGEEVIFTLGAE